MYFGASQRAGHRYRDRLGVLHSPRFFPSNQNPRSRNKEWKRISALSTLLEWVWLFFFLGDCCLMMSCLHFGVWLGTWMRCIGLFFAYYRHCMAQEKKFLFFRLKVNEWYPWSGNFLLVSFVDLTTCFILVCSWHYWQTPKWGSLTIYSLFLVLHALLICLHVLFWCSWHFLQHQSEGVLTIYSLSLVLH